MISMLWAMLSSCGSSDNGSDIEYQTLRINHFKQECVAEAVRPCLLVRQSDDDEWSYFYETIAGFNYEWGFQYELEVAITTLENPLIDGATLQYALVNLVRKIQVQPDTVFEYSSLHAPEQITLQSENTFSLFFWGEAEFVCDAADCATLQSLLEQRQSLLLEFRHPVDNSNPLQLNRILCSDTRASFRDSCLL